MLKNLAKIDWVFVAAAGLLLTLSLILLYSVSSSADKGLDLGDFKKQLIAFCIGLPVMLTLIMFDYRVLNSFSTKLYFLALGLLSLVFVIGSRIRGAKAWISFGGFHLEPVEIVKLVMIIFLASFLSKKKTELSIVWRIIGSVVLTFIPVFLIMKQPDFGSSAVIIAIWGGMLSVSGLSKKNIFILFLAGVVAASSGWFFLKDYQKNRLINFVNPANDPQGSGYNVIQATVAVGSGGLWGKGLGHGSQSQLNFLPEKHTDFIFAVIVEELGLLGAGIVLGLFGVLFYRMKETARLACDNFGYLLAVGVIIMVFTQLVINVGMNIGLVPVAGVPLPLVSYGGSSLIGVLASIGVLQSVYIRRFNAF